MSLSPETVEWLLSNLEFLFNITIRGLTLAAPIAILYRFWYGGKSRLKFKQIKDPRERNWSRHKNNSPILWSNYVHYIAVNRGWWPGIIWDVSLQCVEFNTGERIADGEETLHDVYLDIYKGGESERIDTENPHTREERTLEGRDITHIKLGPKVNENGDFAELATNAETATFYFEAEVEDNKGRSKVPFSAKMDVSDVDTERN
ncbi:hypothetical protein [Halobaculum magnesiiphilum]|uniref:Uncharacterized protein n=1 Tax=Halobaculum magnesiiphilum TaxID=1017351 RepID=A0A8T8WHV5_9EURY|nr:hypothetical protein [Halobaculum magnesiiphilum]QZP39445.1 hypothetical protein K6T50_17840 [Halobaculum magnesiiphilum]